MKVKVPGLYKKRDWWYWSRMIRGHRKTVCLETKDEEVAIEQAKELNARPQIMARGRLASEVKQFIAAKVENDEFTRFSVENKTLTLLRFCRYVGDIDPKDVSEAKMKEWYKIECARVAGSTAQGYLMAVRSFFNWLVKENVIAKNPALSIKIEKWDYGHRVKFCQSKLRDKLLKNAPTPMMGFILHVGFEAGLRRNEIVEARPEWFDLASRTVFVRETDTFRPKDREARAIPMTNVLFKFLKKYPMKGKYCIAPDVERGKGRYRYEFIKPFTAYMEAQGCSWVTPHVMRHTFGSLLAIAGESLLKIARWMGDDTRVVDRHYAHLQPGDRSINRLHGDFSYDPAAKPRRQSAKPRIRPGSTGSKKQAHPPGHKE